MDPLTDHVTCRIGMYEESVKRLAEAMACPDEPDSGIVSRPFCERRLVLALLGRIAPDNPAYADLADEAGRISGELAALGRAHGPRLYQAMREELTACVDRYCTVAGWSSVGVTVPPEEFSYRDRIRVIFDVLGDEPAIRDLRQLIEALDPEAEAFTELVQAPVAAAIPYCRQNTDEYRSPRKIREE